MDCTCELLLTAVPDAGLQVLQLDLYLLIVPHGLFALSPEAQQRSCLSTKEEREFAVC